MFETNNNNYNSPAEYLSQRGYKPAVASAFLKEGKYSKAVEICQEHLAAENNLLSIRLIYARALYHAGQIETAEEQFYSILALDHDNTIALKYLGDIKFANNDTVSAISYYKKIIEIDSDSKILYSKLSSRKKKHTQTITIKRISEPVIIDDKPQKDIHFYTETMGDLYLTQGFPRMAAQVFGKLLESGNNQRLTNKLVKAQENIKEKEKPYVKKKN